jgi:hypothetical protein
VDPTERCGRCTLATWPLPNRLEAFFSQGDVTAVRLNLITCSARKLPTARSLQRAAADVALNLERKAARLGPFPIEVPAKYADEYDA